MKFQLFPTLERIDPKKSPWIYRGVVHQHVQRYQFVKPRVKGKKVLDISCGVGYGSRILAETAQQVIGLDLSKEAIQEAQRRFNAGNITFLEADATRIPLADGAVDAVVSLETIEHLPFDQVDRFFSELNRVLQPGGMLYMSTPDRDVFSLGDTGTNPFHEWEFSRPEFIQRVSKYFSIEAEYGQLFAPKAGLSVAKGLSKGRLGPFVQRLWRFSWGAVPALCKIQPYQASMSGRPFYTLLEARKPS